MRILPLFGKSEKLRISSVKVLDWLINVKEQ